MALTIDERPESPEVDERTNGVSITVKYVFNGTNNYSELRTFVLENTPVTLTFNQRLLGRSGWKPHILPGEWGYVEVIYDSATSEQAAIQPEGLPGQPPTPPTFPTPTDADTLGANWSLSTRGGTTHITTSKEVVNSVMAGGGAPPDYGNLIGVSAQGVRGVDVPGMVISAAITIPTDLNLPIIRNLVRIDEPRTNSQPWLGMAAGEWLYVGCDAQGSDNGAGSLTIHLEGGQNLEAGDDRLVLTSAITLPEKKAHDLVDVYYGTVEIGGFMVQEAKFAVIHRLFDSMSFADAFGLG